MVQSQTMNKILAVVGMPGSGKGTITDHLEDQGYPKVYFGGFVYEEVAARGLDIVKDEKEVREDMRAKEGKEVFAKRAAKRARESFAEGEQLVVFDGVYSWSEWKYLNEQFGEDLVTLAVFTDKATRYKRFAARKDKHRMYTEDDARRRDFEEIENLEKGGPIAIADHTFVNDGTLEDLTAKVDELLEEIKQV